MEKRESTNSNPDTPPLPSHQQEKPFFPPKSQPQILEENSMDRRPYRFSPPPPIRSPLQEENLTSPRESEPQFPPEKPPSTARRPYGYGLSPIQSPPREDNSNSPLESKPGIPAEKTPSTDRRPYGYGLSRIRSPPQEDNSNSPLQEENSTSPPESKPGIPAEKTASTDRHPYGYGLSVSPIRSPLREENSTSPLREKKPITRPEPPPVPVNTVSPVIVVNRSVREEVSVVTKVDPIGDGFSGGYVGGVKNGGDRRSRAVLSILQRQRTEIMVKRAALGIRVFAVVFCLVSFSVMAADKTQGWAGDSFDRYKEYRYCISVTIIGFVYSGFQAYCLAYHLITEKHIISHRLRYYFDFSMDQILTYLLISASSSAATRVDDWQSNWGKDEFTEMASAAVGMSFLAFTAFAFSSLISGYNLCTRNY